MSTSEFTVKVLGTRKIVKDDLGPLGQEAKS
jgi:hypothetical protein